MGKDVLQSGAQELAYRSTTDLKRTCRVDHRIDRFGAEMGLCCSLVTMVDQYVQGGMCRRSWATSCLVEKPALRWLIEISTQHFNFIQKKINGIQQRKAKRLGREAIVSPGGMEATLLKLLSLSSSFPLRAYAKSVGSRRF